MWVVGAMLRGQRLFKILLQPHQLGPGRVEVSIGHRADANGQFKGACMATFKAHQLLTIKQNEVKRVLKVGLPLEFLQISGGAHGALQKSGGDVPARRRIGFVVTWIPVVGQCG